MLKACCRRAADLAVECKVGEFTASFERINEEYVVLTGTRARKKRSRSSCFVLSENAAAVVRVTGIPEAAKVVLCSFLRGISTQEAMKIVVGSSANFEKAKGLVQYWEANISRQKC